MVHRIATDSSHNERAGNRNANAATDAPCERHGCGRSALAARSLCRRTEERDWALNTHSERCDDDAEGQRQAAEERQAHDAHAGTDDQAGNQQLAAIAERHAGACE